MIYTGAPEISVGSPPLRPSRLWYWAAGCMLAVALACVTLAVAGFISLNRQVTDFQRVPAPGRAEVTFTQPGDYVLYVESRGRCCSFSFSVGSGPFGGLSMQGGLMPVNGGSAVQVSNWRGALDSYLIAGRQGQTAGYFRIVHPGTYVLATRNVVPRTITDVAVGRGIFRGMVMPPLLILAALVALLAAGLLFGITASRRRRARRPVPEAAWPGDDPRPPDTVQVGFAGPAPQRRATVLVRIILAVPQLICLYFARYAAAVMIVAGWFGALFTGRLPESLAQFLAGYQRWEVRLYAYLLLLTDMYPPFGWRDTGYPVSVAVRPGRLTRAAVLFRIVLVLPALVVGEVLAYGLGTIIMFVTWLIVLIRGRMPQPLYEAIAAVVRYWARIKGYCWLLTGSYPAGLFGDPPEPAHEHGAWLPPSPPPPGPPPPPGLLLPAEYAAAPAAPVAAAPAPVGVPGPLVLSRPAKRLVGLTLGVGAIAPIALFAAAFVLASAPGPGTAAGTPRPSAAAPATSAQPPAPPSAQPPAPPGTAPAPTRAADKWLSGLQSLSADMTSAMGAGSATVVTANSLRSTARQLSRCSAKLAALGPPPGQLGPVYRQARSACADFERGAACYVTAARAYDPVSAGPGGKFASLLDRGDAAVNKGSYVISMAVANGSFTGTPG